uniref:Activin_recp domain-containing protein n=1 Tax=Parastrongyloides trichosuri TaxID=131310 RepID=A0A0N4ZB27_PARTI
MFYLNVVFLLNFLINFGICTNEDDSTPESGNLFCYVGQKVQYWNEEWVSNLMSVKCGLSYCSNMTIINDDRQEEYKIITEYSCGSDTLGFCENITNDCIKAGIKNITTCCCNTKLCNNSSFLQYSVTLLLIILLMQMLSICL